MKNKLLLWGVIWASALTLFSLILPLILVNKSSQAVPLVPDSQTKNVETSTPDPWIEFHDDVLIPVYLTREHRIESVPLEYYVRGVVAAEMPIDFELEALKAQAIAARTYILHRIIAQDFSHVPHPDAWVTDSVLHQAYITVEQMKQKWPTPKTFDTNLAKLNRAVQETQGMVAVYEDKPINAVFFSTSNGFTENSEDYWSEAVPYLRSVPSPWDEQLSPKYENTVTFPADEVYEKLGLSNAIPAAASGGRSPEFTILETTAGNRIKRISIAGRTFSGREVREKLGLTSSQFRVKRIGDQLEFTSIGYGHGVGMSQWGAQGMAIEGKTAEQIIQYYYQHVELRKWEEFYKKYGT